MAIRGSLKEASLADVCQLLALGLKTGCLSVADKSRFGQIFFDKGRITYARIVNRRDRLGDLLVRDGLLTREQLEGILREQASDPDRRLGDLLIRHGLISRDDLSRYVRQQIEDAVYHLFTWSRGSFSFDVTDQPETADIRVSINPENLLLEAARRVDEWSLIEQKIPSFDLVFDVDREHLANADVDLTPEQRRLSLLLDGTRSLQEVVEVSGLSEFDAGQALYGLIQAGFAHRVGRRAAASRARDAELSEHRNLGLAFYRSGMLDDAAREFDRVISLESNDLQSIFHLGLVAVRQRRFADAVKWFKQVMGLNERHFPSYVNLAVALRGLGRHDEALTVLEDAEQLRAATPTVALARGVTQLQLGDATSARRSLQEYRQRLAADIEPGVLYFFHAALAHAVDGQTEDAERLVDEGLQLYGTAAPLHLLAGLFQERRNQLDDAETSYRRVIDEDPTLVQAYKDLGDVLYRRGAPEDALEQYLRALKRSPDLGDDLYARIGNLLYRAQRHDEAVRYWTRALELNPSNQAVRNNLEIVSHAGS